MEINAIHISIWTLMKLKIKWCLAKLFIGLLCWLGVGTVWLIVFLVFYCLHEGGKK